ncbi:putative B6 ABC transporter permease subunit 1 [Acuticoccus mangrovi]|uniref:ABC transporter permease n=1 Tax=Acuticoccus mangrovi TaxID=2796142 RepID=A0A934IM32_9HYPH|nr:ABC transporter permease [Acuticoccus mangrovi]MBJ3774921.1 ABC transporter permease [Acuticoccus mangrovi]
MEQLLTVAFLTSLLAGAVTAGVPLLLAGLGEQVSEKAGVLNIGIEGMMLVGAYTGFVAAWSTGSFWLGFAAGAAGGMAVALLMALLCVRLGLNQIVVGIALTLGAEGITALLHHVQFSRTYPRLPGVETLPIPFLSEIPVLGRALFDRHPFVYLAVLMVPLLVFVFRRTGLGLHLQAAGDKPAALDAAGVSVVTTRTAAVLFTGAMAGMGGTYMANIGAGLFIPFMTGGAGFIGIVLAMLARGRPGWVLFGALLFGASMALTTALQVGGVNIPTDVIQMVPFAAVMAVLVIFGRRAKLPAALGLPYVRGER